jgi:hypothetical protein
VGKQQMIPTDANRLILKTGCADRTDWHPSAPHFAVCPLQLQLQPNFNFNFKYKRNFVRPPAARARLVVRLQLGWHARLR